MGTPISILFMTETDTLMIQFLVINKHLSDFSTFLRFYLDLDLKNLIPVFLFSPLPPKRDAPHSKGQEAFWGVC